MAELLVATAVTGIIAATLVPLASAVRTGSDYYRDTGLATQHARVALDRIQRTMLGAHANERVPGIIPIITTISGFTYPDAVAVWTPLNGAPNDTSNTGLPLYRELTIYCTSASDARVLVEIVRPNDNTVCPDPTNASAWATLLNTFRNGATTGSQIRELTNLLRTALPSTGAARGCVRFETVLRPTKAEMDGYRALATSSQTYTNWRALMWPQDLYTRESGTRQTWCRIELHLMADPDWQTTDATGQNLLPFFGSAALYYEIPR